MIYRYICILCRFELYFEFYDNNASHTVDLTLYTLH